MKFKSAVLTQVSGSIGGGTWARNKGGMYIRARSMPTNPNTVLQGAIRSILSSLSQQWSTLTPTQRTSWATYAANVPLQDKLGDQRTVTAMNMFIRSNVPRVQAGLGTVVSAPTLFNLGSAPIITGAEVHATGLMALSVSRADILPAGNVLTYVSRSQSPTIGFFRGPFVFSGADSFAASAEDPIEVAATAPFALVVGQKAFIRIQISYADGRLSTDALTSALVVI
jgi:hypothetical protein